MKERLGLNITGRKRIFGAQSIALLLLTMGGFLLRLRYMNTVSPHIDEFATMLVAKSITRTGLPLLPSGALYSRGILFSYLDALFIYIFGFSRTVAELPSLILGTVTIPLLYFVGRRLFSRPVGLIAALLLAFDPEAIRWSARARMYILLQPLVLLAIFFFYLGTVEGKGKRYHYLAIVCFLGAFFSHPEAIFLLPAFALAALLWQGWRWFFQRESVLGGGLCVLAVGTMVFLERRLQLPGWVKVAAYERPFLALTLDRAGAIKLFKPMALVGERLPLTALFVAGFIYTLWWVWKRGWAARREEPQKLTFLYLFFWCGSLILIFFVGSTWRNHRYVFMLLPLFFLVVAALLNRGLVMASQALKKRVQPGSRWSPAVRVEPPLIAYLTVLILCVIYLPPAVAATSEVIAGYDLVLEYVEGYWQEGDVLITTVPAASLVYLGHADYLAIEKGFEGYVFEKEGLLIGGWAGIPMLNSSKQLRQVLDEKSTVWFVTDDYRFRIRYSGEFAQLIWQRMQLVAMERRAMVFLSVPPHSPAVSRSPFEDPVSYRVDLGEEIALVGYELGDKRPRPGGDEQGEVKVRPGEELPIILYWQAQKPIWREYSVFVHLVDEENRLWSQGDDLPLRGLYPTYRWLVGEIMPDRRTLPIPADIPPGTYRLDIGMYLPSTMDRLSVLDAKRSLTEGTLTLDYIWVAGGEKVPFLPQHTLEANLGDSIRLLGYDLSVESGEERMVAPGDMISLTLYWEACEEMGENYTVFVHLLDDQERIWGQHDSYPVGGFYPTSFWDEGEIVQDRHDLTLPLEIPPGRYRLVTGIYLLTSGERLSVRDVDQVLEDDRILVDELMVVNPQ